MTSWIIKRTFNPHAAVNLFCFPYAGGSAAVFNTWRNHLPRFVNQYAIQLPGRDERFDEPMVRDPREVVAALYREMVPLLGEHYAIFGHSLGALLSFELIRKLRDNGHPEPVVYFPSGRHAPQLLHREPVIHALPEAQFIEELKKYGGTPQVLLEHPALMELYLPRLRADFQVSETYVYRCAPKLGCPIFAFGGLGEGNESQEDLQAWGEQTTGPFAHHSIRGNHFFMHSAEQEVVELIVRRLLAQPSVQAVV